MFLAAIVVPGTSTPCPLLLRRAIVARKEEGFPAVFTAHEE